MGTCSNPMCSCDPCGCSDCKCGTANLGELEEKVMAILWAHGSEVSGREVADELPQNAYTTIATILDRLVSKGLVARRKVGGKIRFTPVGSASARTAIMMLDALADSEDPVSSLEQFVASLPANERATLTRLLEKP